MTKVPVVVTVVLLVAGVSPAIAADRYECRKPGDTATIVEIDRDAKAFNFTVDEKDFRLAQTPACEALAEVLTASIGDKGVEIAANSKCDVAFGSTVTVASYVARAGPIDLDLTMAFDRETLMLATTGRFGASEGMSDSAPCKKL